MKLAKTILTLLAAGAVVWFVVWLLTGAFTGRARTTPNTIRLDNFTRITQPH